MYHDTKRRTGLLAISVLLLILLISSACTGALPLNASTSSGQSLATANEPAAAPATSKSPAPLLQDPLAIVAAQEMVLNDIYEQVLPSVVHIQVATRVQQALPDLHQFQFPEMPGLPFQFTPPETPQDPQEFFSRGEGSGFVWDAAGHIVTNHHVVAGADQVTVIFADGATFDAQVLGSDPDADLAVIKVDAPADRLAPVRLGDSDALKVGQMAAAIGNPFGLENTMTFGIVSALGRMIPSGVSSFSIPEVIQTDAPINPGNSGGPLLDREGRVIGINTQIVSRSGSNAGIGFAVPINIAKRVAPALISEGRYSYAWLGISGQDLAPPVAEAMQLPEGSQGALIVRIIEGGPADEAGLQGSDKTLTENDGEHPLGGDVIVSIDGQPVTGMEDLITYLTTQTRPGDTVELALVGSDGQRETVSVVLGERPSQLDQTQQP